MRGTRQGSDHAASLGRYAGMPPLSLHDLAGLTSAVLEAAPPADGGERGPPTERAIRFYISRGCVDTPAGRGATASYRYRHLLQVLFVRASQEAGRNLDEVARDANQPDDVLLGVVGRWLGGPVPDPAELLPGLGIRSAGAMSGDAVPLEAPGLIRRVVVEDGCELLVDVTHPVFRLSPARRAQLRAEVAAAIHRMMAPEGPHFPMA